ncbi:MAG TPA: hypothetical protein VHW60_03470 [Caulobacteraceae bacterium]|nr:hypothetical protein [Caulobacteraceae bacterium]
MTDTTGRPAFGGFASLFLVSAASVGYEIALTRYFAVAKWSEYGYWVISIVMVGLALSGVAVALFRDHLVKWGAGLQAFLPAALVIAGGGGYFLATRNPFNPLELQNQVTLVPQLGYIALYYLDLLPFYFLTGLFISLSFVLNANRISTVYASDLAGAGAGAAAVLLLMFVLHPFTLAPALLAPIALAALFSQRWRLFAGVAAVAALAATETLLVLGPQPQINDFKAVYAPLHTQGAVVMAETRSPSGDYLQLNDFTERVDTDISNNAGMMNVPGPPLTYGLYRDGARIAAIPRPGPLDVRYASATLASVPYLLRPAPRVLLVGASGGFRVGELLSLGAAHVDVTENEPVLRGYLADGGRLSDPRVRLLSVDPVAAAGANTYDIVDLSEDFLDSADANGNDFTAEAVAAYLHATSADGIVSLPVGIRDFPAYALRMLATAREGLREAGVADPATHILVYRSAWNARILVSRTPFSAARIAQLRAWCDDRSFDVSYYPGMDLAASKAGIYNDLPAVSFDKGVVESSATADDAIADEAQAVIANRATPSGAAFQLTPITADRPYYYAVLRLSDLGAIAKRLEILPQQEIGALVNLAVLGQSIVFALIVLATPLLARRKFRPGGNLAKPVAYFSALGLGFLLIEIFLIEKAAFYLGDRTSAFALILTSMLVFSGVGSAISGRFATVPRRGLMLATGLVLIWLMLMFVATQPVMLATLGLPWAARAALLLVFLAPLSIALGLPFPLGLSRIEKDSQLPWAWALNGAFSVVATPVANLMTRETGLGSLLLAAATLYMISYLVFPTPSKAAS